jgi:hypothetical protein
VLCFAAQSIFVCLLLAICPWQYIYFTNLTKGYVGHFLPGYMASYPKRQLSSQSPSWWRQISNFTCRLSRLQLKETIFFASFFLLYEETSTYDIFMSMSVLITFERTDGYLLNFVFYLLFIYLNCKWVLPGGSDTTIRHNTQITHITQNNTPHSNKTQHTKLHKQ